MVFMSQQVNTSRAKPPACLAKRGNRTTSSQLGKLILSYGKYHSEATNCSHLNNVTDEQINCKQTARVALLPTKSASILDLCIEKQRDKIHSSENMSNSTINGAEHSRLEISWVGPRNSIETTQPQNMRKRFICSRFGKQQNCLSQNKERSPVALRNAFYFFLV